MAAAHSITTTRSQAVARPLRILVPLIQDDLQHGKEAAERAGMPYYQAAGEKLLEAKSQFSEREIATGKFNQWIDRNFHLTRESARIYIGYAAAVADKVPSALGASSLSDYIRQTRPNYNRPTPPPAWQEPVSQILGRVDTETLNLKREELKRADERDAQRELGLQLIDIGYKVLAKTLHPDKGGSKEAMARLQAVRERLKQSA